MIQLGRVTLRRTLGQADAEWKSRAEEAVSLYDDFLSKASLIKDETARGRILEWVGRSDMPGSPAERYMAVRRDIAEEAFASDTGKERIGQLETIVSEFGSRVTNALESYGSLPAPGKGAGSETEAVGVTTWCVIGGMALLSLVILPLLSD